MSGLRLGALQEKRLRAWPKDRIRPKSVALGVISLLSEIDHLRAEVAERDVLLEGIVAVNTVQGGRTRIAVEETALSVDEIRVYLAARSEEDGA